MGGAVLQGGAGHQACALLGRGLRVTLGTPRVRGMAGRGMGGWSEWVLVLRDLSWAQPEAGL